MSCGMTDSTVLFMSDFSTLDGVAIDANRIAAIAVDGAYKTGVILKNAWIINTKNEYTDTARHDNHLVYFKGSTNAVIDSCTIKNAACPVSTNIIWDSVANGICGSNSKNLYITDCDIEYTMGANIAIARCDGVLIENNMLSYSSENERWDMDRAGQDAIIGYHNSPHLYNTTIRSNTITEYCHNGIHVSEKGVSQRFLLF
jgi:hypothetical protein